MDGSARKLRHVPERKENMLANRGTSHKMPPQKLGRARLLERADAPNGDAAKNASALLLLARAQLATDNDILDARGKLTCVVNAGRRQAHPGRAASVVPTLNEATLGE